MEYLALVRQADGTSKSMYLNSKEYVNKLRKGLVIDSIYLEGDTYEEKIQYVVDQMASGVFNLDYDAINFSLAN